MEVVNIRTLHSAHLRSLVDEAKCLRRQLSVQKSPLESARVRFGQQQSAFDSFTQSMHALMEASVSQLEEPMIGVESGELAGVKNCGSSLGESVLDRSRQSAPTSISGSHSDTSGPPS